jgi:hypothetical protein
MSSCSPREFTEIAMPDAGQLTRDEVAKLISDAVKAELVTANSKFEKDITGLKSSYDQQIAGLSKSLASSSGGGTDLHKEVEKVKAEQDTKSQADRLTSALTERDALWTARIEAKALGLPDEIVALYDTPAQLKATVALAKHLGSSNKSTPKPAGGGNAGAGPRTGGEGVKLDAIAKLVEGLKPLSELRGGS